MENKIRFEEIKKLENNITSLLDGILKYIQPYEDLRLEMKALTADSHPVFGAFDYEHMYTVFKDYLHQGLHDRGLPGGIDDHVEGTELLDYRCH